MAVVEDSPVERAAAFPSRSVRPGQQCVARAVYGDGGVLAIFADARRRDEA